ncbi:MAG: hypothetical protein PVG61_02870 [Dehalococcoidia bacterium]|jgi:hypothetical protein
MGKYAKYVNELRLWTEIIRPSYRGKMADFSLMFDQKVFPESKIWVETFHVYAPGSGVMVPGELPMLVNGQEVIDKGGQHTHPDFDELFLFFGSNPHDVLSLGGEVEFWLGEGEDAQKFIADTPTAEWVPRGVAHNPHYFSKINNRDLPIIEMAIAMTPTYNLSPETFNEIPLPPAFSMEKIGLEQKGKGLYTEYVNQIKLATDRVFPSFRGKVATPTLMFDRNIYPGAKIWVEIFHVYAAGAGVGIPSLEPYIFTGGITSDTEGGGHAHDFDELFLFIGLDPHDTLNLGGEVEFWLGEGDEAEKFVTTKATAEWVPAGVIHNPHYFRRVDRPFLMVVIAMTGDYDSGEMRHAPLPPGFKL